MFILTEGGKSTYSARHDGSALWAQDLGDEGMAF